MISPLATFLSLGAFAERPSQIPLENPGGFFSWSLISSAGSARAGVQELAATQDTRGAPVPVKKQLLANMGSKRALKRAPLANPSKVPKDEARFHRVKKGDLSVTTQNKQIYKPQS